MPMCICQNDFPTRSWPVPSSPGLALAALATIFFWNGTSATGQAIAPPARLIVSPADGALAADPSTAVYDFGRSWLPNDAMLAHTFALRWDGPGILTVAQIHAACECTVASVAGNRQLQPPFPMGPGTELQLSVRVDPAQLGEGRFEKVVWVYTADQAMPAATLYVTGSLRSSPSVTPPQLDFGTLEVGQSRSLLFTAELAKPADATGRLRVECSNAEVLVAVVGLGAAIPAHETGDSWRGTYLATVLPRDIPGPVRGSAVIYLDRDREPSGAPTTYHVATVPIQGVVAGPVTARPDSVDFGQVHPSATAQRDVELTVSKALPAALSVSCVSSYIHARLIRTPAHTDAIPRARPAGTKAPPRLAHRPTGPPPTVLRVTLGPSIPSGSFETRLVLFSGPTPELAIPVKATVGPR